MDSPSPATLDEAALEARFSAALAAAGSPAELDVVNREFLGKKSELKSALANLKALPPDERAATAKRLNALQAGFEARFAAAKAEVAERALAAQLAGEWEDLTLPGTAPRRGSVHPITDVEQRCLAVLRQLGFTLEEGPEVELPFYNFDALNIPEHHPAREMQDTFFVTGGRLLRSHTTSVQARVLEQRRPPPIKVASAGRVYRNEATDATHLPMFHQLEGFWLEKGLTLAHLKGILWFVGRALYGEDVALRIKPKFYPYTEPSLGMDIQCTNCRGAGCGACHGAGWVTVIGAGMIHRNVLELFGYDPDEVSGLAFGWGTTRLTSQWVGVKKLKPLYEQDLRLLNAIHRRS